MSFRLIIHIPRRTLKLLLYTALGIFVLFMALTRTQVGREELRIQLEKQFKQHFVGEIRIGRLQGNLLNTLYAEDIDIVDSAGVLVAAVDAAVLEPSWLELLTRTVSLNRITLIQPKLNAFREEDGSWNIGGVFRRRDPGRILAPMAFTSSEIRIMDGVVRTHSDGPLPESVERGRLFNYTEAVLTDVQAQLNVEWRPDLKLLDVDRLSFCLESEDIDVVDIHGQYMWQNDRIELNEVYVETAGTHLRLVGSLDRVNLMQASPGEMILDLDVHESRIDHDELRRLFPAHSMADTMRVTARVRGPLNALLVDRVNVERGDLSLEVSGVVRGFPDTLDYALSFSNSILSRSDVARLYPPLDRIQVPADAVLQVRSFDTRGKLPLNPIDLKEAFHSETLFDLGSAWGGLHGRIEVGRTAKDSLTVFAGSLEVDSLRVEGFLSNRGVTSNLRGSMSLQGEGDRLADMSADLKMGFHRSTIQGHPLDTLDVYLYLHDRVFAYDLMARNRLYGTVRSDGVVRFDRETPTAEADLEFARLDLGRILRSDSLETRLNGRMQVAVTGREPSSWRGTARLSMDSSLVTTGSMQRVIPPHAMALSLKDESAEKQIFRIDGDLLAFSAKTAWDPILLHSLGRMWYASLNASTKKIINKEAVWRATYIDETGALYTTLADLEAERLYESANAVFEEHRGDEPLDIDLAFEVRHAEFWSSWLPDVPDIATDTEGSLQLRATPSVLSLSGQLHADSLRIDTAGLDSLTSRFTIEADRTRSLESMFRASILVQADSLRLAGYATPSLELQMGLAEGSGDLSIVTANNDTDDGQRLAARLSMLPDRNRVYLEELSLSLGNSRWDAEVETYIDVFGRTLEIPGIVMQSKSDENDLLQRVYLSGVLSPLPGDTASFVIDNIALRPVSQGLDMEMPMGGMLSGQLSLTTAESQPELTGSIHIDRFTLGKYVLGDIDIGSQYIQGRPDVGLRVEVSPAPAAEQDPLLTGALIPADYKENALLLDGTFRLPRFNKTATGFADAGELDLQLTMTRADLFFFELIFPNLLEQTGGYLTGHGTIGGDFDFPVFDAELQLVEGKVSIPKFNVAYTNFEGPVRVDREGILLDGAEFRDATGGNAVVSGRFLFNDYRYFSFDLETRLNELLIMNQDYSDELPFYGQIWASGTATLTGPTHNAVLRSQDAVTRASSELFIPVTEDEVTSDVGFLIFADSTGEMPDLNRLLYRKNLLSKRPEGERKFIDGLSMDLNIFAPSGSTIHLVFDPLLGDVINAVSSGRIQIQKKEGAFATYGTLNVESGDYLFTAGDVFARKFLIDRGGTITWDGNPINAALSIPASYRTRASTAGLPGGVFEENSQIPLIVSLDITGRVASPEVELSLRTDRSDRNYRGNYEGIETILNRSERIQEYATSVLLTNSFVLTTEANPNADALTNSGNQIAFSSVSQLVASQLNRFLNEALPNMDLSLGLQGESLENPDLTYGVSLYLLDDRLVVRGEGIYQNDQQQNQPGLEGEFVVELRLSPSISLSVFLRREGDVLSENALTSTRGAGLAYQTQFPSWRRFIDRLFGWMGKKKEAPPPEQVAQRPNE